MIFNLQAAKPDVTAEIHYQARVWIHWSGGDVGTVYTCLCNII